MSQRLWFALGGALLTVTLGCLAFLHLFTSIAPYDDTGYILSLVENFNAHGALYRETFSQYGPFFSEFYFLVARVLQVPMTQDGIRWVVLVIWIAITVLAGVIAFRLTQKVWLALLTQAICFHFLRALLREPGHPVSLSALPLMLLALFLSSERSEGVTRKQALWAGALLGMLGMTKINLGLFALAAVGGALIYSAPRNGVGRALRFATAFAFPSLAVLLIKSWPNEFRLQFVVVFSAAVLAILVSARGSTMPWPRLLRFTSWMLLAGALVSLASIAIILFTGTTLGDLVRGLIVRPMKLADAFIYVPEMSRHTASMAIASLIVACGCRFLCAKNPALGEPLGFAMRLLFIAVVVFWVGGWLQPWAAFALSWVAVLPTKTANAREEAETSWVQLSLALLPVAQMLGLYPVGGAQKVVPCALLTLALVPTFEGLFAFARAQSSLVAQRFTLGLASLAAVLLGYHSASVMLDEFQRKRAEFVEKIPLDLPGAHLTRVDRLAAATYHCLAENLGHTQPSFVSVPGVNSLYRWAKRPYPTGFNTTHNFAILSDAEQQRIVEVGRSCRPIAAIFHRELLYDFWTRGRFQPRGPLIDFVSHECRLLLRVRGYDLLALQNEPSATLTYFAVLQTNSSPNESSKIVRVVLPPRLAGVASVSLLDDANRKAMPQRIGVGEVQETHGALGFTFTGVDADTLSTETLDRFLVQLWNDKGEWLADLPFAQTID